MKLEDFSKAAQAAIMRLAAKSGATPRAIITAYERAAKGDGVNLDSLYLA